MLNYLDVFPQRSIYLLPYSSSAVRLCYVAKVLECRRLRAHATGWPIVVTQGAEDSGASSHNDFSCYRYPRISPHRVLHSTLAPIGLAGGLHVVVYYCQLVLHDKNPRYC